MQGNTQDQQQRPPSHRWAVRFGEAATLVNAASFQLVQDAVWRYFRELLPRGVTKADIAFEGRCFASAQAPLATVLSEDSLSAFNDACRQFLPNGSMPSVTLLFLNNVPASPLPSPSVATTADHVPSPLPSSSPATGGGAAIPTQEPHVSSTAPAPRKSQRVSDRLNNIKKSYGDMYSSSGSVERQRAAAEVSALAKAATSSSPMKRGPPPAAASIQRPAEQRGGMPPSARGELQRYQQELEDAERELREAPSAAVSSQRQKAAAPPPALPLHGAPSTPSRSPAEQLPTHNTTPNANTTVQLMAWGMQVRRGVPIPFNPWQPPPLSSLKRMASSLLDQPASCVWYKSEHDAVEIDVEDDDDVAMLANTILQSGCEHITLYVQNSVKSDGLPVSYVRLKREARREAKERTLNADTTNSTNQTPLTSPIKDVSAPSPPPGGAYQHHYQVTSSASSAAATGSKRREYTKPPPSMVECLD